MWLVRQAIRSCQQQRNLDQLTQTRHLITYINAHLKEDTPPIQSVVSYLPHPQIWRYFINDRKLHISQQAAIEFIRTYKKFDLAVECVFTDWIEEIESIATGLL